jgi:hypothetical protein
VSVEIVNADPRYSKVHLIEPAPLGYLHLAGDVEAPHRPGPVLRRSRQKHQLMGILKWHARQLNQMDTVERATVYDAIAFAPPGGDAKYRPTLLPSARFDVVVLVETASPDAIGEVRSARAYQVLVEALTEQARQVHQVAARNVRRVGDVDKTRPGVFLFNYFVGNDPDLAVRLWDYLAGWYEAEAGLDNSTLLIPLDGEKSDYVMINHARLDQSLPLFMARQLPKKTFRSYMLANLTAHHVAAMPVLYRLA